MKVDFGQIEEIKEVEGIKEVDAIFGRTPLTEFAERIVLASRGCAEITG